MPITVKELINKKYKRACREYLKSQSEWEKNKEGFWRLAEEFYSEGKSFLEDFFYRPKKKIKTGKRKKSLNFGSLVQRCVDYFIELEGRFEDYLNQPYFCRVALPQNLFQRLKEEEDIKSTNSVISISGFTIKSFPNLQSRIEIKTPEFTRTYDIPSYGLKEILESP